jgi:predicted RNA-binding Zn-ribbon protein involved in translation (DUF1610 family)
MLLTTFHLPVDGLVEEFSKLKEDRAMDKLCSTCGQHIDPAWKFCPGCGSAYAPVANRTPKDSEPEAAPAKGAFSGLLFGMIAMPILLIVGAMLCLTGLGAILGIPMIIAGICAPLVGPMMGLGALKGDCPWCGIPVSSVANSKDFSCHGCGKRIAIKHRHIVAAIS